MSTTRAKLRCFMVRSARDVAAQALPNWAQIAATLAQNFYDVFVDCPDAERGALLEEAERVSASEWASIRSQVASELGERYAEALDQARSAMRQAARASNQSEGLRRGLNETLIEGGALRIEARRGGARQGAGAARSLLIESRAGEPPPRDRWPSVPGFELTGWLGEGATANVFIACREGSDVGKSQRVALKVGVLRDRERFAREVEMMERASRARSPHLLTALSHGIIEGFAPLFWIEMPLMGGHTLADTGPLELEEGVRLCLGVLKGLKALHKAGVAHRDLKPSNVLLSARGEPRLADFGLSKQMSDAGASITTTGSVLGSPAYMSPEAINGDRVGLAGDVWSLGVLICELLTGHLPFPGRVAGQVWAAALRDAPDLSGLPEWLKPGVEACLTKSADKRPPNASKLEQHLESPLREYVSGEEARRVRAGQLADRIAELQGLIKSEAELKLHVEHELVTVIDALSSSQIARQIESLAERYRARFVERSTEQSALRQELLMLEAESRGGPLPNGLARLEEFVIERERVVVEDIVERGFMGISKRITQRERSVTESTRCRVEVYSLEEIEFKLIQLPNRMMMIGQTQVTQALYQAVTGQNPSHFKKGENWPVENISWEDCIVFCNALSELSGLTPAYRGTDNHCELIKGANGFRLPFEAEWEFAALGGQRFEYAGSDQIDEVAWCKDNSSGETHPVGQKKANGYGLYDMTGNVWEWCADDYDNPGQHRPGASGRAFRGGGWNYYANGCRVSYRSSRSPNLRYVNLGLRLSRSVQ